MKIKIAIIINTVSYRGPANVVLNILKSLDKNKYDITLITIKDANDQSVIEKLESDSINVKQFNLKGKLNILKNIKSIREYINSSNFEIVHCHGITPDFICSNLNSNIKTISTIHCNLYEDYYCRFGKILGFFAVKMDIMFLNKINCNVCCSKSVFDALKNKIKNVKYIVNGVDLRKNCDEECDLNLLKNKYKIPKNAFIYVFAGTLKKVKNVKNMVIEFKKCHDDDEYLLIVGDGDDLEECKILSKDDSNIIYAGRQKNVYDYMKLSDVYISFSLSEGMSISCLEALASGNYLLLSNIPSHSELVNNPDMYLGEVFDFNNFKQRKCILRKKIDDVKNKSSIIQYHKNNYSSYAMASKYQEEYDKLLLKK